MLDIRKTARKAEFKRPRGIQISVLEVVAEVVRSAARGSGDPESELTIGTRALVTGILRRAGEREEVAARALRHTARAVIRHTAEMRGDLTSSTRGLILGAAASARGLGMSKPTAVTLAGRAALEEAAELGGVAAKRVRGALKVVRLFR